MYRKSQNIEISAILYLKKSLFDIPSSTSKAYQYLSRHPFQYLFDDLATREISACCNIEKINSQRDITVLLYICFWIFCYGKCFIVHLSQLLFPNFFIFFIPFHSMNGLVLQKMNFVHDIQAISISFFLSM